MGQTMPVLKEATRETEAVEHKDRDLARDKGRVDKVHAAVMVVARHAVATVVVRHAAVTVAHRHAAMAAAVDIVAPVVVAEAVAAPAQVAVDMAAVADTDNL